MAKGAFDKVLKDVLELVNLSIMTEICSLDEAHKETVIADMENLKAQLLRILQQQLAFWKVPPWSMAGIASPNVLDAQAAARRCMPQFDEADGKIGAAVGDSTGLPDRVVARVMVGELRRQLEAFVNGAPELREIVLPSCCAPIVQGVIEAQHAVIHKFCAARHVKGPYVSGVLRCPQVEVKCENSAYQFRLEGAFCKARNDSLL